MSAFTQEVRGSTVGSIPGGGYASPNGHSCWCRRGDVTTTARSLSCPALVHDPLDNDVSFAIQSKRRGSCPASVKAFPLTDRCRRRMADGITCNGISGSCRATCAPSSSVRACAHKLDHL